MAADTLRQMKPRTPDELEYWSKALDLCADDLATCSLDRFEDKRLKIVAILKNAAAVYHRPDAALLAAEQERDRLEKRCRIQELATPIEEELSNRIDEALKYLAMEDGFTLSGLARLFVDCQKRMAQDWLDIGSLLRDKKAAEQEQERLEEEDTRLHGVIHRLHCERDDAKELVALREGEIRALREQLRVGPPAFLQAWRKFVNDGINKHGLSRRPETFLANGQDIEAYMDYIENLYPERPRIYRFKGVALVEDPSIAPGGCAIIWGEEDPGAGRS